MSAAAAVPRPPVPAWARRFYKASTTIERTSLALLLGLLTVSGVWSLINFLHTHTEVVPERGGIYREAAVGQPRHLNPILASANDLDLDISRLVYTGLFRYNAELKLENDLAQDVAVSEDRRQYTITLRDNVQWHDGQPLTANDVVFTIRSIQTPGYGSPLARTFEGVKVEKKDDRTIVFTLPEPYVPFLSSLTIGIVPEHVWADIEPQNATLAEQILKPVGTGPFKFADITTRRKTGDITNFRLVRNDNYYGSAPYLNEINFTFFSTNMEAVQALAAGSVDGLGFLPLQLADQADRHSITIHRLLLPQYFAVFFNQQKNEVLNDSGVRAALSLAVDRSALVTEALQGEGEPLHLPIPPGVLDITAPATAETTNVTVAEQNLDDAGWQKGEDGIRTKDGKRLAFKLSTTDWPEYVRTAEIIQQQLRGIGVEVTLEHLAAGTIQQTIIQPREYEALLFGNVLPADPDPYPFWHSTQTRSPGLNLALFKNQTVDRLLEEGRKESDPETRAEKYREFQNKILELHPAIILYRPYYLFATRGVRSVTVHYAAHPAGRFNQVEQWHFKTKRVWK